MSILIVEALSEGLIFAADRNITAPYQDGTSKQIGPRSKVLKWPNERAIVGFVGAAQINNQPIHEWIQKFIEEFRDFPSFEELAKELSCRVEKQRKIDEGANLPELLIIHLGGFEERKGTMVPVVWVIRNTHKDGHYEYKDIRKEFECIEAFWKYFPETDPDEIRRALKVRAKQFQPFWFHQGFDLITFNVLQDALKSSFKFLCEQHPDHDFPKSLADWEKYLRLQVLMYGSYYEAFFPSGQQFVGGGVDIESIPWPGPPQKIVGEESMIAQLEVQPEIVALLNGAKLRGVSIDALLREALRTVLPPPAAQAKLQAFLEAMAAGSENAPVLPPEANERAFYYEGQD